MIKAAVCQSFGEDLSIETIRIRAPRAVEVEVRIEACAICHSDIAYADGAWGGTLPMVLGHEAVGRITALGEGVSDYGLGDRVLVTLIRACGACPSCESDAPTSCDHAWDTRPSPLSNEDGPVTQAMSTGAFAERVVVDASQCHAIADDLDPAVASLLSCGVITGFGAVTNTARLKEGQTCLVIGAGGVGLNTIQAAHLSGAARVIAMDLSEDKLTAATLFGATDGVLATAPDKLAAVRKLTGGRGVDFVFVTVGAPAVFASAPDYLAPGGAVVLVGMPPSGTEIAYDPGTLAAMNQSLLGSRMGQTVLSRDIPMLLDHYNAGRLKLDELVSGRYPIEQINTAIADVKAGRALRNVIVFDT